MLANKLILLLGIILMTSLVSASYESTFNLGNNYNTTGSNTSLTSIGANSVSFNYTNINIMANSIEIVDVLYTYGNLQVTYTGLLNLTHVNSNIDTGSFPRITSQSDTRIAMSSSLSALTASITATTTGSNTCTELNKITYTPNSGSATTYEGQAARDRCSGNTISLSSVSIPGTIDLEYGTSGLASMALRILIGLLAISVLLFAVAGFTSYSNKGFQDVEVMTFVKWAVGLLLVTVIIIVLINYIVTIS